MAFRRCNHRHTPTIVAVIITVLSNQNTASLLSIGASANGSNTNNNLNSCGGVRECAGCCKRITERFLLKALDLYWHEDCLKCGCCDCRLGEVGSTLYTKANLILCKRDYLRSVTRANTQCFSILFHGNLLISSFFSFGIIHHRQIHFWMYFNFSFQIIWQYRSLCSLYQSYSCVWNGYEGQK